MNVFHFLLDENVPRIIYTLLQQKVTQRQVYMVGDGFAPSKGTLDPEILVWIETNHCLLITNNRASMPSHLREHLAQGRHVLGILQLPRQMDLRILLDDIVLIAENASREDFKDQIVYLPL